MASVFKGSISFGLINIPVKLFTATDKKTVAFRTLHKACLNPINQKRWCNECETEVEYADTVKGYEISKGEFITVTAEDLKKIDLKSSKYIQILDFVKLSQIDPIFFDKPYFLSPDASGEKAYVLLHKAMIKMGTAAIARITMREKESICLIRVYGETLMLSTMLFENEIRSADTSVAVLEKKADVSTQELDLACKIVENLIGEFDPSKYYDRYYDELMKIIEAKTDGTSPKLVHESARTQSTKSLDLFEKLKASVEATKANTAKIAKVPSAKAKAANPKKKKADSIPPPKKNNTSHLSV